MKRLSLIAIGLLALPVFPACGEGPTEPAALQKVPEADDPTPPPPRPPGKTRAVLAIVPSSYTLGIGRTHQLHAVYTSPKGKRVDADLMVDWSSSDRAVAVVSHGGQIRGLARGTAEIRARFQGLQARAFVRVIEFPDEDEDPNGNDPRRRGLW